jgi:hypothetical protein
VKKEKHPRIDKMKTTTLVLLSYLLSVLALVSYEYELVKPYICGVMLSGSLVCVGLSVSLAKKTK